MEAQPLHMAIILKLLSDAAEKAEKKVLLLHCCFACFYIVVDLMELF